VRNISKGDAPREYVEWKEKNNHILATCTFGSISPEAKKALQKQLCYEQGHICCYCMSRIDASDTKMRVEHWEPQSEEDGKIFDYKNMMAACCGNDGKNRPLQHCDVRKRNDPLKFNPSSDDVEAIIKYKPSGVISSTDPGFNAQMGTPSDPGVLNLNLGRLKNNRREALEALRMKLEKEGRWVKSQISRKIDELQSPDADGKIEPYCGILIHYLKKKLQQLH